MRDCVDYRFLVPLNSETKSYFKTNYKKNWQSSDGSPFCHIDEGLLVLRNELQNFPENLKYRTYEISDRFIDDKDFICAFWDGDCEDEDFVLV